jgi:hypothetical protein
VARIKLHVTPGAREDSIPGWRGDALHLKVKARPEKGRANQAVLALLARRLRLPRARLAIVHGAGSRDKVVEVDGLSEDELRTLVSR